MKLDWKYVAMGLLVAGWAHDLRVGRYYRRRYRSTQKSFDKMEALARLYADELIKNDIPITEFHRIVLNTIVDS